MKQQYILTNTNSFNPKHICECGQCFRWNDRPDGSYTGVFGNNVLNVKQENNQIIFSGICDGNIEEICKDYFDLDTDYNKIKVELSKIDDNLKQGIKYGEGIRILKQDLWEMIISYIISANNNIPRIKKIIERISEKYGNRLELDGEIFYTFPTVEQLSKATVEELPAASSANKGHVYVVGNKEYASDGSSWILLGDEGSYVLKTTYEAHLETQAEVDKGQSDKIKAIEDDIKANRESWASKTSVTDPTAGDGKITVDGVEMVVYDDSALAGRVSTVEGKVKTLEETTIPTLATKEEVKVERERIDSIVNTTIPTLATKAEVKDAINNSHTHSNKDILDATTASFTTDLKTK